MRSTRFSVTKVELKLKPQSRPDRIESDIRLSKAFLIENKPGGTRGKVGCGAYTQIKEILIGVVGSSGELTVRLFE
jgi:hypothetical protein